MATRIVTTTGGGPTHGAAVAETMTQGPAGIPTAAAAGAGRGMDGGIEGMGAGQRQGSLRTRTGGGAVVEGAGVTAIGAGSRITTTGSRAGAANGIDGNGTERLG